MHDKLRPKQRQTRIKKHPEKAKSWFGNRRRHLDFVACNTTCVHVHIRNTHTHTTLARPSELYRIQFQLDVELSKSSHTLQLTNTHIRIVEEQKRRKHTHTLLVFDHFHSVSLDSDQVVFFFTATLRYSIVGFECLFLSMCCAHPFV